MVPCPHCAATVPVAEFLSAATGYDPVVHTVVWQCPACDESNPFRIVDGAVEIGYVYWTGTAHFATMDDVAVPGLALHGGPDLMTVTLDGRRWMIGR